MSESSGTRRGDDRARERRPGYAPARHRRLCRARRRSLEDPAWFWPARRSRTWGSSSRSRGTQVFDDSRGRSGRPGSPAASSRSRATASTAGRAARARRVAAVGLGRGRRAAGAHLRRAVARGDAPRRGARRPRRRRRRPRRDLPADVAGGRRSPRTRARTSARSRCRSSPASPRPPSRSACRTREAKVVITPTARSAAAASADDRRSSTRRSREAPSRRARRRLAPLDDAPMRGVTRLGRALPRCARGRLRDAVPAHLHLRHDRASRRASCTCRAASSSRSRARSRYQADVHAGDVLHFADRHGLDHGALDGGRRRRARRHDRLRRGRARLAGADRLWRTVEQERVTSLGLSPTLVRALIPHGAARRHDLSSLRMFVTTGEPWNPEPYRWLFERGRRRARPDHQLLRRHRGRRLLPLADAGRRRSRRARSAARRSGWRWTSSTTTGARSSAAARSASSSAASRSPA